LQRWLVHSLARPGTAWRCPARPGLSGVDRRRGGRQVFRLSINGAEAGARATGIEALFPGKR